MINIQEVTETNQMISEMNLDVRTITLGISLLDCIDSDLEQLKEKIYRRITSVAKDLVAVGSEIEKKYVFDDTIITATHVYSKDSSLSFHVVSFIKVKDDKIVSVDEYWGDDGMAPQWRLDKHIGTPIIKKEA